jgi:hypothetical protein
MKIAIMQPYFLPYIGYFQLMQSVDKFVIYDDVNYIKQGWINRNAILLNGERFVFTMQLKNAGSFKKINEVQVGNQNEKLLKTFTYYYKKAPYFDVVSPMLEEIVLYSEKNLAGFVSHSIKRLTEYLNIDTEIIISSVLDKNNDLKGQDKVLHICKCLNANVYINAIGGKDIYSKEKFAEQNIELRFIHSRPLNYKQFDNEFVPWLSVVDIMMFNPVEKITEMLNQYDLI